MFELTCKTSVYEIPISVRSSYRLSVYYGSGVDLILEGVKGWQNLFRFSSDERGAKFYQFCPHEQGLFFGANLEAYLCNKSTYEHQFYV